MDFSKLLSKLSVIEGKQSLTIPSSLINKTTDDAELGKLVRETMIKKIEDCEKHVEYMKSL
jgi:hypothetical protein